ncbi:MAG: hypothetical protein QGH94_15115 [Phycisphaerae bacterium]|jgi:hypothetical protein|nr:hypothetical protein [Phycisphaerae bacterium]
MRTKHFDLWLEFEEFDPSEPWDADNEFFNMAIMHDGKRYVLTVWSYGFLQKELADPSARNDGFVEAPDLLVDTCTRSHMEAVVDKLI